MDKLQSIGKVKLSGEIRISGSKNAGLAIMAGSLLCDKPITLIDVPDIKDIYSMSKLLLSFGSKISFDATKIDKYGVDVPILNIDNSNIQKQVAGYDFVKTMRASVFTLGPLLTRFKKAKVSLPGGCAIGVRGVDLHIACLEKLGAEIDINDGYIYATASKGLIGNKVVFPNVSVGATENVMCAAVLAKGTTIIKNAAKEPEVVSLAEFLNSMGAKIKGYGTKTIAIEGVKQSDLHETSFRIPPDRIEAGTYAIATAVTNGKVLLKNCNMSIFNGVHKVFDKIGIGLKEIKNDKNNAVIDGVLAFKSHDFCACNIKTSVYPGFPTDLQAQIMIPLLLAKGKSEVNEKIFENRFMHVAELARMGAKIVVKGSKAVIYGKANCLKCANVMATDLRASASLVIASLVAKGMTIIDRIYHLDRGYENIEMKLNNCGADIKRI